jgi:hypothetical protein
MPTYTTITENRDGTYSLTLHNADALRRIQTMFDIIREDDDDADDAERNATAAYAEDLYRVIDDALTLADPAGETCPNCEPHHAPCADCAALAH